MALWQYLLLLSGGLLLVFFACTSPDGFFRMLSRLGVNAACGLALLVALDTLAPDRLILPLNALTLSVSSLFGAPGIAAMAVMAAL